jgi:hypothetical protein
MKIMGANQTNEKTKNYHQRFLPSLLAAVTQEIDNGRTCYGMEQVNGKTSVSEIPSNFKIEVAEKVDDHQSQ